MKIWPAAQTSPGPLGGAWIGWECRKDAVGLWWKCGSSPIQMYVTVGRDRLCPILKILMICGDAPKNTWQSRTRTISNTVIGCLRFGYVSPPPIRSGPLGACNFFGYANCDRVTETWLRGLFWKLSTGLRFVLNVDNAFVDVRLYYCQCHCQFSKVHEALCWWSTKRTFFCGKHSCGVV